MKDEIVIRRSIYTGKEHKLIWSGTGKLYYFKPAEDWMPVYLTYAGDSRSIIALDSDGFGEPLAIGDTVDGMVVEAIIEFDEKTCVIFK